jgi:hypothetical protein
MVLGGTNRCTKFGVYDLARQQFVRTGITSNTKLFTANSPDDSRLLHFVELMNEVNLKGEIRPITCGIAALDGVN